MAEPSGPEPAGAGAAGEGGERRTSEQPGGAGAEVWTPSVHDRIAALEAENRAVTERMLRIAAEGENRSKRAGRERADAVRHEREAVLLDVLDVVDSLERALASLGERSDPGQVRQGVELTLRLLAQKLDRYGVKPVEAAGRPFDPRLHDAVAKEPSNEVEPGTVLAEVQKGYTADDHLLRPATVVVAEEASAAAASPGGAGVGAEHRGP